MNAYVVSVPVADAADPAGAVTAGKWRTELVADLGYVKGSNMNGWPSADIGTRRSCTGGTHGPTPGCGRGPTQARSDSIPTWGWTHAYPQPVLSSLAFDIDGYLNLGFTDRTAIQSGNLNVGSDIDLPDESVLRDGRQRRHPRRRSGGPRPADGSGMPDDCDRSVRTRVQRQGRNPRRAHGHRRPGQTPTYNNNQGPVTGEFFNDSMDTGASGGFTTTTPSARSRPIPVSTR